MAGVDPVFGVKVTRLFFKDLNGKIVTKEKEINNSVRNSKENFFRFREVTLAKVL
jgi:hypothetical protein